MAASTILEPIKVNDERGAQIIVDALENAENTERKTVRRASSVVTTDPRLCSTHIPLSNIIIEY